MNWSRWSALLAVAVLATTLAPAAHAVDGVTLINQATALHPLPGCAPAESSELINICQPGSYRLAGNIVASGTYQIAINIRTSNVVLDLNGFTLTGGPGGSAITQVDADRASVLIADNTIVENGEISGVIDLAFTHGVTVRNVTVVADTAIKVGAQATVSDSTLRGTSGVSSTRGVDIESGTIRNTVIDGFNFDVNVVNGGHVLISGCTIQNASNAGIAKNFGNSNFGGLAGFGSTVFFNNAQDVVPGAGQSMGNNVSSSGSTF